MPLVFIIYLLNTITVLFWTRCKKEKENNLRGPDTIQSKVPVQRGRLWFYNSMLEGLPRG